MGEAEMTKEKRLASCLLLAELDAY